MSEQQGSNTVRLYHLSSPTEDDMGYRDIAAVYSAGKEYFISNYFRPLQQVPE